MKIRLIKTIKLSEIFPRPYAEIAEDEDVLRLGVEWIPGGMETLLGLEYVRPLTVAQMDWLTPRWERWRERFPGKVS